MRNESRWLTMTSLSWPLSKNVLSYLTYTSFAFMPTSFLDSSFRCVHCSLKFNYPSSPLSFEVTSHRQLCPLTLATTSPDLDLQGSRSAFHKGPISKSAKGSFLFACKVYRSLSLFSRLPFFEWEECFCPCPAVSAAQGFISNLGYGVT